MKNNDCLADFFAFSAIVFAEKENAEKSQTENQCRCTGNNCKNQQNITKELLSDITKCEKLLAGIKQKLVSAVE